MSASYLITYILASIATGALAVAGINVVFSVFPALKPLAGLTGALFIFTIGWSIEWIKSKTASKSNWR